MKALIVRPDGTSISVEGSPEEIARLAREAGIGAPRPALPLPDLMPPTIDFVRVRPPGCCCPQPNPLGGPMGWGGTCPVHSMRVTMRTGIGAIS